MEGRSQARDREKNPAWIRRRLDAPGKDPGETGAHHEQNVLSFHPSVWVHMHDIIDKRTSVYQEGVYDRTPEQHHSSIPYAAVLLHSLVRCLADEDSPTLLGYWAMTVTR